MALVKKKIKRPFLWSIIYSGTSLVLIEVGVMLFRVGLRAQGFVSGLIGLILLAIEIAVFLPELIKNALKETKFSMLFRITTMGVLFIVLIFLIAIAAINTGNNLLYIVLSFLISAISVSGIVSRISLSKLRFSVEYQDVIFANEYTSYRLKIKNGKKRFPSFSIGVEGYLVNNQCYDIEMMCDLAMQDTSKDNYLAIRSRKKIRTTAYFPYIPPGGEDSLTYKIKFPARGVYSINMINVTTGTPFGFFRKGRRIKTSGDLIVFPAPIEKESLHSFIDEHAETLPLLKRGLGSELYSLKEYNYGEDVRFIHWKASAKTGNFIVKDFSSESIAEFIFFLDEGVVEISAEIIACFEKLVSVLTTLSLELEDKGKRISLVLSHTDSDKFTLRNSLLDVLEGFALTCLHEVRKPSEHPFNNRMHLEELFQRRNSCVSLCSFQPLSVFPFLSPYIDNYIDMRLL